MVIIWGVLIFIHFNINGYNDKDSQGKLFEVITIAVRQLTGISRVQTSPPSLQFNCMATFVATDIIICFFANVLETITWLGTK